MTLMDQAEALMSRDEGMFLENVTLQLLSLPAEGFGEGIVSLSDPGTQSVPGQSFGISGTAYSLPTLLNTLQ